MKAPNQNVSFRNKCQAISILLFFIFLSVTSYAQTYNFSSAGATGRFGPNQAQINAAYSGTNLDGAVTINTQGIQEWTVPVSGIYRITTTGASGGNSLWSSISGGLGATLTSDFTITAGTTLKILVGHPGENAAVGGGGGGTFVTDISNSPLLIAGAGGGASSDRPGGNANLTNNGGASGPIPSSTGGNGGNACLAGTNNNSGGGGGGLLTDGQSPNSGTENAGFGGLSFFNGGIGAQPGRLDGACSDDAFGGFGGGGSTSCRTVGGAGGGGYSGGAGGPHYTQCNGGFSRWGGGGGGSFNAGTLISSSVNNVGFGAVTITFLAPADNPPTAICLDFTAQLDASGSVTIQPSDVDGGSSDVEGPVTLSLDIDTFDCSDIGTPVTVTLTVTDSAGQTDSCTATVTVEDNIPPTITCPSDITVNTDPGVCGAVVTYTVPTATDNCDSAGSSSQTFNFTGTLQNFTVPAGVTELSIEAYGAQGGDAQGGVYPGGRGAYMSGDFSVVPGEQLIILVGGQGVSDANHAGGGGGSFVVKQVGTSSFQMISGEFVEPMLIAGGGGGAAPFTIGTADFIFGSTGTSGANCTGSGYTTLGGTSGNGGETVHAGGGGGFATDGVQLGVISNTVESYGKSFLNLGAGGTPLFGGAGGYGGGGGGHAGVNAGGAGGGYSGGGGGLRYYGGGAGSFNNGTNQNNLPDAQTGNGLVTISWSSANPIAVTQTDGTGLTSGDLFPLGTTTLEYTATDASGNTSVCTFDIIVEDNEAPVITCAASDLRDTDPGVCEYTVVGTEFDATFTDNCTTSVLTNDLNGTDTIAGEVLPLGDTTVTWTVDDGNGNTATCSVTITVEDNEAPLIVCPSDVVANTDPSVCGAEVFFADALATDNCGIASVVQTAGLPSGSFFPVGVSTVEYTATDVNGNVSICSFTITITDNEAPMAVCQDITIQLDTNGDASITAADIDGGSTDNCGVDTIVASQTDFNCADVGDNTITLTVTDVNGNVSTCTAIVTVEDVTNPIALCQDITVELDASGTVTIDPSDVDGGSSDACGIGTLELDIDTFGCENVGENTVTLTVTDENGNVSTCSAIVTVQDNTAPVLVCQDITVELDENGQASIVANDLIASNDDACGILTTAADIVDFDCDDIGAPILVNVFSSDNNGNLSSCEAFVTVIDALPPVIEDCPEDVTVDPGPNNLFYELPDYWATSGATPTDNCTDPVTILGQDPAPGTLLADGTYTITLTAEDEYGNIGICEFELTVESTLSNDDNKLEQSIGLYPNPADSFVNIRNSSNIEIESIIIFDMNGRLVQRETIGNSAFENTLDVSYLASGVYVVQIKGENDTMTVKRLMKE